MSSSDAIVVEGLGKRYRLREGPRYGTLRDRIADFAAGRRHAPARDLWALRDTTFTVARGEVLGMVGGNGAGKSTLLKLLARITAPSAGRASIRGRVGSLLEVGSGFHPELTGRENIFLNGTIIGMRRVEIARRFDQIVAFAEVERFLDLPVKRYSSGMYTRLAFAIAAHLDCDVLLLDEVLAVGDAGFQKKCLGRIGEVAGDGRTVILVSHNLPSIRSACQRVLWLERGTVVACDRTDAILDRYVRKGMAPVDATDVLRQIAALPEDPAIRLLAISVTQDGVPTSEPLSGRPVDVTIDYEVKRETHGLRVYVILRDDEGTPLFRSFAYGEDDELPTMRPGRYRSRVAIPADLLAPISYRVEISAAVHNERHCFPSGISLPIMVHDAGRLRHAYAAGGGIAVKLAPALPWSTERLEEDPCSHQ